MPLAPAPDQGLFWRRGVAKRVRRVLVVQNARHEGPGHLAAPLEEAGATLEIVQAWDGARLPATVERYHALLVLGGPPSAYDLASGPWMARVLDLLRAAHGRVPILGVCLGAQLAAHALGGRARPGEAGAEVGFHALRWHADELGAPPLALQLHHDTYDLPPGAVRLASSARYAEQAFRLGRATYGVQFHVEMRAAGLAPILEADRKDLEAEGVDVDALLREAAQRDGAMADAARRLAEAWWALSGA
ncbi:MAG: hypothetical protein QOE90_2195 [Thermoplasmata archaeon]|nr:hypothetical protein [Thermoplasmata archaeon]